MKTRNILFLTAILAANLQYAGAGGVSTGTYEGATLTISGSGYGTKSPAPPLIWANGENGSINPTTLGQRTTWDSNDNLTIVSSDTMIGGSSRQFKGTWSDSNGSFSVASNGNITKTFVYGNRRFDYAPHPVGSGSRKIQRINSAFGSTDFVISLDASNGNVAFNECAAGANRNQSGIKLFQTAWNRETFLWSRGATGCSGDDATSDGVAIYRVNGTTNVATYNYCNCQTHDEMRLFDTFSSDNKPANGSNVWMDNFYYDETWTRVTVSSDNFINEYPAIPSSWSDTQVVALLHIADIAEGTTIKYRVYNDNNAVVEQGDVTAGVGQTNVAPYFSGATSSSATIKFTSVGTNDYTAALGSDSSFTTVIASATASTLIRTFTGLNPGTTYYAKVKISTESDNSYTTISTFTYNSRVSPSTASITSSGATINWNTSANMTYAVGNANFSSILTSSTVSGAATVNITGASPSTTYAYKVKFSTDGDGGYNQDAFTTTSGAAGAPTPPAPPRIQGPVTIQGNVRFGRP